MVLKLEYVLKVTENSDSFRGAYLREDISHKLGSKKFLSSTLLTTISNSHRFSNLLDAKNLLDKLRDTKVISNNDKSAASSLQWKIVELTITTTQKDIDSEDIANKAKQKQISENNDKIRALRAENLDLNNSINVKSKNWDNSNNIFSKDEIASLFGSNKEDRKLESGENSLKDAPEIDLSGASFTDMLVKLAMKTYNENNKNNS